MQVDVTHFTPQRRRQTFNSNNLADGAGGCHAVSKKGNKKRRNRAEGAPVSLTFVQYNPLREQVMHMSRCRIQHTL
jgi:hypothetical protein